jgi:hypothetical protein
MSRSFAEIIFMAPPTQYFPKLKPAKSIIRMGLWRSLACISDLQCAKEDQVDICGFRMGISRFSIKFRPFRLEIAEAAFFSQICKKKTLAPQNRALGALFSQCRPSSLSRASIHPPGQE